jgi:hypothetical protein
LKKSLNLKNLNNGFRFSSVHYYSLKDDSVNYFRMNVRRCYQAVKEAGFDCCLGEATVIAGLLAGYAGQGPRDHERWGLPSRISKFGSAELVRAGPAHLAAG